MIDYFENGCTECGGEVEYNEASYFYRCSSCGAFVSAHRKATQYSKEGEPTGRLATQEMCNLKKQLDPIFNYFWKSKYVFQVGNKTQEVAPINIVYASYIRKIDKDGEEFYGEMVTNKDGLVELSIVDESEVYRLSHSELRLVTNREKTHVWLSLELGLPVRECKIGYLDKTNLLKALEICTKYKEYAERQKVGSIEVGS
jgi:predicted RNA-binding Zn-ribbon protein involved in translation (DUF1610 family)